ncbi:hypothetical protein CAEBREN_08862 [Caenorhabditis brenneri]|uniref:Uncharacterized protein n=1 Tax=Caenorhabditis brenneri TaxID=135651 RepID=G0P016_CAEBE|nr:hypothetical protein CAEBREN_08862 [Caenorhabditis brenneri]
MAFYCKNCMQSAESVKSLAGYIGIEVEDPRGPIKMYLTRDRSECGCPEELPKHLKSVKLTDAEVKWFTEAREFDAKEKKLEAEKKEEMDVMKNEDKENVVPSQKSHRKRVKKETKNRPYISKMNAEKRKKVEAEPRSDAQTEANIMKILMDAEKDIIREEEAKADDDIYSITGFDD